MASLEGNKLFAAILTAGIIGVGSGVFSSILYKPHAPEEPVYVVEAAAPAGGEAAESAPAEEVQPIGPLLAAANADNGKTISKKCAACHDLSSGNTNKVGPGLWNIVNRPIAEHPGFTYSAALEEKKGTPWDYEHLSQFLHAPKEYAPGTKMSFAGLPKEQDRADLLAFLRTLADQPAPLPGG